MIHFASAHIKLFSMTKIRQWRHTKLAKEESRSFTIRDHLTSLFYQGCAIEQCNQETNKWLVYVLERRKWERRGRIDLLRPGKLLILDEFRYCCTPCEIDPRVSSAVFRDFIVFFLRKENKWKQAYISILHYKWNFNLNYMYWLLSAELLLKSEFLLMV